MVCLKGQRTEDHYRIRFHQSQTLPWKRGSLRNCNVLLYFALTEPRLGVSLQLNTETVYIQVVFLNYPQGLRFLTQRYAWLRSNKRFSVTFNNWWPWYNYQGKMCVFMHLYICRGNFTYIRKQLYYILFKSKKGF